MSKTVDGASAEGAPAKDRSRAPFKLWQRLYDLHERAWTAAIDRMTPTSAFAAASGKFLEVSLLVQGVVRDTMRSYLEAINLPSREDIARLGELVVGLEEKIDQLDDRLSRMEAAQAAGAARAGEG